MFNNRRANQTARFLLSTFAAVALNFLTPQEVIGSPNPDQVLARINGLSLWQTGAINSDTFGIRPGVNITQADYEVMRDYKYEQLRLLMGSDFDINQIDTPNTRRLILDETINQMLLLYLVTSKPMSFDRYLRDTIVRIQAAFSRDMVVFYPKRYRQILRFQEIMPTEFETRVLSELVNLKIFRELSGPIGIFEDEKEDRIEKLNGARTVSIQRFNSSDFEDSTEISNDMLRQWYASNSELLRNPPAPFVNINYLILDRKTARKDVSVSDDDLEAYFQKNQPLTNVSEQQRASHILIEVDSDASKVSKKLAHELAQTIANRLRKDPNQFAQLAEYFSDDDETSKRGGDLGWVTYEKLSPQLGQALFNLEPDTVSEVIEGPYGFHVAIVTQVLPNENEQVSKIKNNLREEMLQEQTSVRFAEMLTDLTNRIGNQTDPSDRIADITWDLSNLDDWKNVGLLDTWFAGSITRLGIIPDEMKTSKFNEPELGHRAILNNPRVLEAAFSPSVAYASLPSDPIEVNPETVVVLTGRISKQRLVRPLNDVRDFVEDEMFTELSLQLARQAGEEALMAINEGQAPDDDLSATQVVSNVDKGTLTMAELEAVMMVPAEKLPRFVGVNTATGFSVIKVAQAPGNQDPPIEKLEQLSYKKRQYEGLFWQLKNLFNVKKFAEPYRFIEKNE